MGEGGLPDLPKITFPDEKLWAQGEVPSPPPRVRPYNIFLFYLGYKMIIFFLFTQQDMRRTESLAKIPQAHHPHVIQIP